MEIELTIGASPEDSGEMSDISQSSTIWKKVGEWRTPNENRQTIVANAEVLKNSTTRSCDQQAVRRSTLTNRRCHRKGAEDGLTRESARPGEARPQGPVLHGSPAAQG
ncbi:hypothetical protein HAX54_028664, partial [Datura stramonium]|nr:hypothetical protein [Datura stramonium]